LREHGESIRLASEHKTVEALKKIYDELAIVSKKLTHSDLKLADFEQKVFECANLTESIQKSMVYCKQTCDDALKTAMTI
jgi:hypothetical protein